MGLQLHLDNQSHIQFAVLWIITCIHLHAFAIGHEQAERKNAWLEEQEKQAMEEEEERENMRDIELLEGRIKREELKKSLYEFLYQSK
ncbi:hypothetical protein V8B97DRAFT_779629 [Scleroderma yunnanense]